MAKPPRLSSRAAALPERERLDIPLWQSREVSTRDAIGASVFAVDLRGHGFSPWTPPWSVEQHVADVIEVIASLGLDSVAVVGHSFGGMIALHLARLAPRVVERLLVTIPRGLLSP